MNARTSVFALGRVFLMIILVFVSKVDCQDNSQRRLPPARFAAEPEAGLKRSSAIVFRIKDAAFIRAYEDVVRILRGSNSCSEFFGGPAAVTVFNELAAEMTKIYSNESTGIRMYGPQTTIEIAGSSLHYRMFARAEINGHGSFFHQNIFDGVPKTPRVGRFSPNTREARTLMLLHELGHLIAFAPGQWLLPNDGNDEWQSQDNTYIVLKHCEQAIKAKPGAN